MQRRTFLKGLMASPLLGFLGKKVDAEPRITLADVKKARDSMDFPKNPNLGDTFTTGHGLCGKTYLYCYFPEAEKFHWGQIRGYANVKVSS